MNIQDDYNLWAAQYDSNENKTRDLEAISLRATLPDAAFGNCLEMGCGTGKNTEWLITKAKELTAVDFSSEMLQIAQAKINSGNVKFVQADINNEWNFGVDRFDLVTFSLVLEHIENLNDVFRKLTKITTNHGLVYVGELHPAKQYLGTKARFETREGLQTLTCFTHHISDFTEAAEQNGFETIHFSEFFDNNDRTTIPRILSMLFRKKKSQKE